MPARLPVASLSLAELLSDPHRLTVPAYQRPYSWTRREADQLLEDVLAASGVESVVGAEPDYFLGTVLLLDADRAGFAPPSGGELRRLEIIDGQQRLVTLTIIAAVLRDLFADHDRTLARALDQLVAAPVAGTDETAGLRIALRGADGAFLVEYVQQPDACRQMPPHDDLTIGQERLLEVREGFLARLADLGVEEARRLTDFLRDRCHVVVALSQDIDHAHRTFTVLNERGRPLARNDILKAELLRATAPDRQDALVTRWDTVTANLGGDLEHFLSHIRTIHGETRTPILAGVRSIVVGAGGAEPFVNRVVAPLSRAYRLAIDAAERDGLLPAAATGRLVALSRLSAGDWMPAAMLALAEHEDDPDSLERLLAEIERLAYLLRLLCQGSGRRLTRFAGVVAAIRSGEALAAGAGAFEITRDEARQIAHNLKDLHRRNPAHCKLVLLRLGEEASGEMMRVDPATLSVEHVLPQRPRAGSEWRRWIPDPVERERATNALGNLVLIGARANERARNRELARKCEIYAEVADAPLRALMHEVLEAEEWDHATVAARDARLLALLERTWRVDLGRAGKERSDAGLLAEEQKRVLRSD
ncbi:MAG: DUF262 domain-containing HNH endonuclease family protein [Pseudomonadota bacterium]